MARLGFLPTSPALPRHARQAPPDYGASASPSWRDIDWSNYRSQIRLSSSTVNVIDLPGPDGNPSASAVVFVHGLGGCWQNWLETLAPISQHHRAVAMDLPGFGESEMPSGQISITGYAACVDELCEFLGLESVIVVGNSMGGFIAAEMGIRYGRRLEAIALVAAAGISSTQLRRRPTATAARLTAAIGSYTASQGRSVVSRPRLRHALMATVMRHPTLIAPDLLYEQLRGSAKPGFEHALTALLTYDFRHRLPEIAQPTLVVWGQNDMLVPVSDAHEFERLIPNTQRKLILEGTGHVPMLERPTAFNRHLLDFLTSLEQSQTGQSGPVSNTHGTL
jgi:pimeloyl-ACP methyl ester carboxylesterase